MIDSIFMKLKNRQNLNYVDRNQNSGRWWEE